MPTVRVLVLVLVQGCVWSSCEGGNPGVTCDAIRNETTHPLKNCLFEDENGGDGVVCEIMAQYGGPETPGDEVGFIHARFSFSLLQKDLGNGSSLCVAAKGLLMEKVFSKGNWSNATYARLNPVTELVLPFIKTLGAVATFDASKAMAWLDVDRECYLRYSRNSSCISALRIVSEYWDLRLQDHNPFHAEFWSQVKRPYFGLLGAQMLSLEVTLKKQTMVPFVQTLLPMFINGTGLRRFRANGFSMERPGRLLPPLPLLEDADFNDDGIVDMDPDNFAATPNLTRLDLGSNALSAVPSTVWSLRRLTSLSLSGNALLASASLGVNLPRLFALRELFLSGIPLLTLATLAPALGPASPLRLYALDVSRCGLNDSSAGDVLAAQTSLRRLDLGGNPLRRLPPGLFLQMRNLSTLLVSDAGLAEPPRLQVHAAATLDVLDLSRNALVSGVGLVVSGKVSLLNLSRNALRAATPEDTRAFDSLLAVDLGGNPLDCDDCATPTFKKWLINTHVVVFGLGRRDAVVCAAPAQDADVRVVDVTFRRYSQCRFALWAIFVGVGVAVTLLPLGVAFCFRYEIRYVAAKRKSAEDSEEFVYDASVVFCRSDRPWVLELKRASRRLRLCLHESDFPLESLVRWRLETALQRSRTTVVVLTPAFAADKWCWWALEMAVLFSPRLLLVELWPRLRKDELTRRLQSLFDNPATPRLGWPSADVGSGYAMRRLVRRLQGDEHIQESAADEDDDVGEQTPLLQ